MHAKPPATAEVWILQPSIEHYRAPVFDAVRALGEGRYDLKILGPLKDGAGTGGVRRPWFEDQPYTTKQIAGQIMTWWPGVEARIRRRRPEAVIVGGGPRCLSAWRLPSVCHGMGIAPICWSKIHSFSGLPAPLTTVVKGGLYRRYDRAIVYGDASKAELIRLGYPEARIHVAHNTIDVGRIFEQGEAIAARGRALAEAAGVADKRLIVCVGRMDADKRQGDLLAAWPALQTLIPDAALVLVGGGPDLESREAQAHALDPTGQRVVVTGRVPEGDDYAWLSAASVAISPGAVGLSINQSLAFGVPTVIADEPGADGEIVRDGETGWRYRRGDVPALVDVVAGVMADEAKAAAIAAAGRRLMREEITLEAMAATLDGAIRAALPEAAM